MNWILSGLFLISFLAGWFLHSVFTPISNCETELSNSENASSFKYRKPKRLPSSVKSQASFESKGESIEQGLDDNLEMNIYDEFKHKLAFHTVQRNYEDKRLLITNAIETKLLEQDLINQVVSEEFQSMLDSGTLPQPGYYEDILSALPTVDDRKRIFHNLHFHKAHADIPKDNFEAFSEYFQSYR